ncbi:hypothetical protein FHW16_004819 [Phyllobacterium myrsinacearum]|uniref:Uncharacterized protein n=1 Tax=Phyllobacterium myrsinacearum TaxID=28101 RepID=A0A839EUA4_9HYPH|nr:hypothetical protein [Phyllobacterium myrsinacearum]
MTNTIEPSKNVTWQVMDLCTRQAYGPIVRPLRGHGSAYDLEETGERQVRGDASRSCHTLWRSRSNT